MTMDSGVAWVDRDALGRRAMLTEILAQVSREALQGEGLEAVLKCIVDCLVRRLPVAIASIILLDGAGAHFDQEVWAGELQLMRPTAAPWPIGMGRPAVARDRRGPANRRCQRRSRLRAGEYRGAFRSHCARLIFYSRRHALQNPDASKLNARLPAEAALTRTSDKATRIDFPAIVQERRTRSWTRIASKAPSTRPRVP